MNKKSVTLLTKHYHGYAIVAAGFVVQGTIVGAIFTYGVFFDALHTELGWSRAAISAAPSLASLVMGFTAMLFGRLTDVTGPRRILSAAGIAVTLGYLIMSRMTMQWHLLVAYPIFIGVAFGSHDVVTLSAVARWFERRRGRMSAIVKVGTGTGQVIGPAAAAVLISLFGWRNAYLWIAVVTGPLVFLAARWMYRSPEDAGVPHQDAAILPGFAPASVAVAEASTPTPPPVDASAPVAVPEPPPQRAREMMRRPEFIRLGIAQGAVLFCTPIIIVHLVPHATDLGLDRAVAAGLLSVIGGFSIAGRMVMGSIIDKVGGRRALLYCYAIMLAAFVLLQFAAGPLLLYLFALIYGFAHGGIFTCVSPFVAELFGVRVHGLLFGTIIFVGTLAGSIGPTVAGAVFDLSGSYRPAFLLLIVLLLVAAGSIASIRPQAAQS
ncbi:MAG: MFS transporter [Spirochaeta sp.]|nr:MFS transporter [Spirochaeta sp.]